MIGRGAEPAAAAAALALGVAMLRRGGRVIGWGAVPAAVAAALGVAMLRREAA